jgi:hypothetical protein
MLEKLERLATWSLPWLASVFISACLTYSLTAMVAGAQSPAVQAESLSVVCGTPDDRMLVYAVTTHRVPAPAGGGCQDQ